MRGANAVRWWLVAIPIALAGCDGDQVNLERCIAGLKEAARGTGTYGDLAELERRKNVFVSKSRVSGWSDTEDIYQVSFTSDGQQTSLLCALPR